VASLGFHARHLVGSIDRLLTYARGEALSQGQVEYLRREGVASDPAPTSEVLAAEVAQAIDMAIAQVRATSVDSMFEARAVGRARLPTTVFGLIVHVAEHSARHAGQMTTTARLVR
jgi:hypothetical protein